MGGLFLLGGLAGLVLLSLPVVLLIGLLAILILRREDDPEGNRAPALYGAVVAFIGLLALLFAATGAVSSLADLTAGNSHGGLGSSTSSSFSTSSSGGTSFGGSRTVDDDDAAISSAVASVIVAAVALGLLFAHRPLFARRATAAGSAHRVLRGYLLLMCLAAALIAMVAGGIGLYTLYGAIFPGTAGVGNRADELRSLVTIVILFVGAAGLWHWHWRQLDLGPRPEVTAAAAP
jgi:hypothetical protein